MTIGFAALEVHNLLHMQPWNAFGRLVMLALRLEESLFLHKLEWTKYYQSRVNNSFVNYSSQDGIVHRGV